MKKYKNIGIDPTTVGMKLRKQAIERDVSYQQHCEDILEYQANNNTIILSKKKKKTKSFIKPVAIEVDFSNNKPAIVHDLETGESKTLEPTEDNPITKDEKKGAYDRSENNIYTNGKIWEYRIFVPGVGPKSKYFRIKEDAIDAKEKEEALKKSK